MMIKIGDRVKLTEEIKGVLRRNGSKSHVKEFGNCVGIVECLTDYGTQQGPEFDVRWQPSKLRYAYDARFLEVVGDESI